MKPDSTEVKDATKLALALFSALATPWAERLFVQPFTQLLVDICAAVLQPFDGRVQAQGDILRFSDGRGAVQVLAGCNAVEVCALLTAAILAFPGRLRDGVIGGAGFDVLSKEPPLAGNPLLAPDIPNFILTPHVAWASAGAMQTLADMLIDNVEAYLRGAPANTV